MRMEDFAGKVAYLGLDLSATRDLTGVGYVFLDGLNDEGKQKYALFARGYTPKETLHERAQTDKAPYEAWAEAGFLIPTKGKVIRYDIIARDMYQFSQDYELVELAYDRYLIRSFEDELDDIGAYLPLAEHPQGLNHRTGTELWMPQSIDEIEALLLEGRLRIEVNPALRSAVASVSMYESAAGLRRFEKNKSTARIDIAVAITMAIGSATNRDGGLDIGAMFG